MGLWLLVWAAGAALAEAGNEQTLTAWIEQDWASQDRLYRGGQLQAGAVLEVIRQIRPAPAGLLKAYEELTSSGARPEDPRWRELYGRAGRLRREQRLAPYREALRRVVFTKHYDLGGSHYAYTEGLSDAQAERHFRPGSALCLLEMDEAGGAGRVRVLLEDRKGVIRDPDVSFDGKRILFSWKKSSREDDYHLHEMSVADGAVRQLTSGLGFADYEGAYLPDGQIVFNSTRCVQTVDCWWTEVSNLYTCDGDGRHLRRLSFDQVHTNFPTLTPDGRVLYTRWDYNDRGQIYPQGLFQMNPDGTGQAEVYGNNSWFPTTILHARAIPGTQKIVAIFTGHHTIQKGWLGILDPAKGRQENQGAQLIAPLRPTPAERIDAYGQTGDQFQYPYPLSESAFLVACRPEREGSKRFGLYLVTADGQRELLAADEQISCNQPIPLAARTPPAPRPSLVDYRKGTGTYYVQDIYQGPGLAGVARGTIKRLRVVALEFRAAGIGENGSGGEAGGALASTPVSIGNGTWDVKRVLGEAKVYEDGSAFFQVPAQTPVYFQAIDAKGHAVQTMRSWSTLQPGETSACIGCHEEKNTAPPSAYGRSMATRAGAQQLAGFYGPPRGFSFAREIQPILDRHCISCHKDSDRPIPAARPRNLPPQEAAPGSIAFSLLGSEVLDSKAKRKWSAAYLALTAARRRQEQDSFQGRPTKLVNWVHVQSAPPMLPPYHAGAARSRLMTLLEENHGGAKLSGQEFEKIACWIDLLVPFCGDYTEANAWSEEEVRKYEHFLAKRQGMQAIEKKNIEAMLSAESR